MMSWDYFIAHATTDTAQAEALYRHLAAPPPLRAFLDTKSLLPGDDWTKKIPHAQRSARATVALISERAGDAFYLGDELHTAIAWYRKEPDRHRLIPVLLAKTPGTRSSKGRGREGENARSRPPERPLMALT